jgi:hypothetical protein
MVYDRLCLYAVEEEGWLVGAEDNVRSEGSSRWQRVGQSILHSESLSKMKLYGVHSQWNVFTVLLRSEQYNNGPVEGLSVEIMCTDEHCQNINGECSMDMPHPLLVLCSWKGKTIRLLPLWAVRPVRSLNACARVHFTLPSMDMTGSHVNIQTWAHDCP